jgi:hypothetical protein
MELGACGPNAQAIRARLFFSNRRFPDFIFGQGCSTRGTPAGFKNQIFVSPAFSVRAFDAARDLRATRNRN